MLTAEAVDTINTFERPNAVTPSPVSVSAADGKITLRLPPHSITVVQLEP